MEQTKDLMIGDNRIACRWIEGALPGIVWLGGYMSDMRGTKAEALYEWAAQQGRAYVRFDYSGHGISKGAFEEGSISLWASEALGVIKQLANGVQILVGSSMGGWISLLICRALYRELGADTPIKGLVLIAPAVDFTQELMWADLSEDQQTELMTKGVIEKPSDYEEPYRITRKLIEDGKNNLLLKSPIKTHCPVHILQGRDDNLVPWKHAIRLVEHLPGEDVDFTLVPDGDHSLSRVPDLVLLKRSISQMLEKIT